MIKELSVENLRKRAEPSGLHCKTTKELTPLEGIIGQRRAVKALRFGLDIKEEGFNIYVAGLPGTGRKTTVKGFLEEVAKSKPVPSDWCYVNNFVNSHQPRAIELPTGKGKEFQMDMRSFVNNARSFLPRAFESEDYAAKRDSLVASIDKERKELLSKLNERAKKEGFVLQSTPDRKSVV